MTEKQILVGQLVDLDLTGALIQSQDGLTDPAHVLRAEALLGAPKPMQELTSST